MEITNRGKGWHPHIHAVIDCKWLAVKTPAPKPFDSRATILRKCKLAAEEVGARWARAYGVPRCSIKIKRAYTAETVDQSYGRSESIAIEVLKYSVKTGDLLTCADPIGDLIRVLSCTRLVSSHGSCYGRDLDDEEQQSYDGAMCECGSTGSWMPDDVIDRLCRRPINYLR